MATPTIIIGIGSSGLFTLEHVQRFYYESFKSNKPDHVEYLFIETNKDNKVGITPLPNEIKRVFISLEEMKKMSVVIKNEGAKWVPPLEDLLNAGLGAGGVRPFGRVGLWGKNNKANNFRNVVESINQAHQKVSKDTSQPIVFITGTLTGGTGSGVFIDLAYIIRHLISNIQELYGLFLIPNKPSDIVENAQYYANTYASFRDLDRFNSKDTVYSEKWPITQTPVEFKEPPFELVQFVSQDYLDGSPAISNLGGLYKMAGLYLFLNMIGIKEKRTERLVDSPIGKYGSFGLSAIQYPKDQIEEYVASLLSTELLERWINPKQYIINNALFPILEGSIGEQAINKWNDIIKEAFESLNTIGGIGGKDLIKEIEAKAIKINKKDINEEPEDCLNNLFSSSISNNYYGQVKNNIQTAVNSIVDQIHDLNIDTLDKTENLSFTKIVLQKIVDSIEKNIKYWKSIGISEKPEQWNNLLRKQCDWMIRNRYKIVFEQDAVLKDRILTTFELMKMHLMIPKLMEIISYIKRDDDVPYKSTISEKELPRLKTFEQLVTKIAELTGKIDSKEMSLKRRKEVIEMDLNDKTIPILRIYQSGSFDKEYQNAEEFYNQKAENKTRTKTDIINEDLWSFLTEQGSNFHAVVYEKTLNAYRKLINKYECVPDYEVANYLIENPDKGVIYAKKGLSGFISLKKFLTHDHYMPRFIAGSSEASITKVLNLFRDKHSFTDFSDDPNQKLEIPDLKNILVFYDEKMNFNPLKDISYIDDMKQVYENKPTNIEGTNDMWLNYRNAYFRVESKNNA